MKIRSLALASLFTVSVGSVLSVVSAQAQFASSVVDYNAGTGFAAGFTNASAALGAPTAGGAVTPLAPPYAKTQLVSIGAGGDIALQLSTPITSNPADPYGIDFILFGNQFFVNSSSGVSGLYDHAASIQVQVSPDDVNWYTLNPALTPQPGTLYPTDGSGNPQIPVNPALTLANFTGQNLAGVKSLYAGSAGGTGYALDWALDANNNPVNLASADYVRLEVQSGVLDLDAVSVVPEPTAWSLLPAGLGLLWLVRRIKNGRNARSAFPLDPWLLLFTLVLAVSPGRAATITENFATNPLANGWSIYGETNLFTWDSTNEVEDVTWDSSQPDSFLYRPLGNVLAIDDDFSLSFDLKLNDATGYVYSMQLAVDLFHFTDATNASYSRADATLPNVFEFAYFPGTDLISPSLDATLTDSNVDYYFAYDNQVLTPGVTYSVTIAHAAGSPTVTGQVLAEGEPFSSFPNVYTQTISDFRLDTVSISSFQDDGYGDSILAHGSVANLVVTLPPSPVQNLTGYFTNGAWAASFTTRTNWFYTLESSPDLQHWTAVNANNAGTSTNLVLFDTSPATTNAFYRILAQRP
jgi:hypothetical protein